MTRTEIEDHRKAMADTTRLIRDLLEERRKLFEQRHVAQRSKRRGGDPDLLDKCQRQIPHVERQIRELRAKRKRAKLALGEVGT